MHTHFPTSWPLGKGAIGKTICQLVLLGGLSTSMIGFGPAKSLGSQSAKPAMALVAQSPALSAGEVFQLRLRLSGTSQIETPLIDVTIYDRVRTRTRFTQTLKGASGSALRTIPFPVSQTSGSGDGELPIEIPMLRPGEPDRLDALPALEPGVYPITVSLRSKDASDQLARLSTNLIRSPDSLTAQPLRVAFVQPFGAAPALEPSGNNELKRATRARLESIAQVLQEVPTTPLSVAPTPETLDALAATQSPSLDEMAKALEGRQLIAGTYVDVDLPSLGDTALLDRLLAQRTEGLTTLDRHLQRRAGARTWVQKGSLDSRSLGNLVDLGIDRIVVTEHVLAPLSAPLTLAKPFQLQDTQGRTVSAAAINDAMGTHLEDPDDPVLAAFNLLADLAVVYFESPGTLRGVIVRPPIDSMAPESLQVLLRLLTSSPTLFQPVTLDDYFEQLESSSSEKAPLLRRFVRSRPQSIQEFDASLEKLQHDLRAAATMVTADDAAMNLARRLLLVSDSSGFKGEERERYRTSSQQQIVNIAERIRIVDRGTYRLTDQEGTVPITLTNTDPGSPAKVQLHLQSDKLDFLDGSPDKQGEFTKNLVLNKANTTLEVRVRYRTPGEFPMDLRVTTPDGKLLLLQGRFEVRSTAISGVGALLSLGAGLFLLIWWARHWRSARRASRLVARPAISHE